MASFSERYGYKRVRDALQIESMDEALRNGLWNALYTCCLSDWESRGYLVQEDYLFVETLWLDYYKEPVDERPDHSSNIIPLLKHRFGKFEWNEVYDFLEFFVGFYPFDSHQLERFTRLCNGTLQREMSAYRFISGQITHITSEEEIDAIEVATSSKSPSPVKAHLQRALELMSDRKTPDYRNSIKESISAVESLASTIMGQPTTLGHAIKKLENKIEIHTALKESFSKLYGYTSDADGIRHAMMEESDLSFEDAKFMLVSCSAFVNYLIEKSAKAGLNLDTSQS